MGFDPNQNNLISYSASTRTWTLNGRSLAPGVAWFEGNLKLQVGTFYNTFIASGNIATAANINSHGINYAGYSNVCASTDYSTIYPTNYCNKVSMTLTSDAIGNIGLLAGSYDAGHYLDQNYFRGGVITLAAGSYIYGDLIAGDYFSTSGDAHIFGYIVASNQSRTLSTSTLSGGTTIDLTTLTGFDPGTVDTGGASGGGTPNAKILWSRYL